MKERLMQMKRALVFLLAMVMGLMMCSSSLAATAEYYTTQEFLDYLDRQGVIYALEGIDNANYEVVKVNNQGDAFTYDIKFFFDDSMENTGIRVWDVIEYSDADFAKVVRICNTLNDNYRYAKFTADESDNTVTCALDLIYRANDIAEIHWEATLRLVDILNSGYEALCIYDQ